MENDSRKILTDELVNSELHWWNVPGITAGICKDGKVLQCEGFGCRDVSRKLPMTGETLGGIASCSKSFCSAVIASLVDEGVLDFDRPVHEYLPELEFMDPAATKECTLRDMLYHRTGLAGHDAMWPDATITRKEYLRRIRFLEPNVPFRYKAQYSNTIYNLAGIVAEEVTGTRYEDLVQQRILDPLGMSHTTLSVRTMRETTNWAAGYLERAPRPEEERSDPDAWLKGLEEMPGWEMNVGVPAAGVNSCPADMLKWITLHLQNGMYEGRQLFSRQVMDELHTPGEVMSAFPWRFPEVPGIGDYGMAWKTTVYRGRILRYHCGEIEGYSSIECFLPDENLGMFLLCNRHAPVTPFLLGLVYTAIDRALGLTPIDWPARLHPYLNVNDGSCEGWKLDLCGDSSPKTGLTASGCGSASAETVPDGIAAADNQQTNPAERPDDSLCPFRHANAECIGSYHSDAYGTYRICEKDGRLCLVYKDWILPLEHLSGNLFKVPELKEDTLFIDMPLQFTEESVQSENGMTDSAGSESASTIQTGRTNDKITGRIDDKIVGRIAGFTLRLERTVKPVYFRKI